MWVLSQFINENDKVFASTKRKVKIGGDASTKQVTKIIFTELLVKKTSFENETLKVTGQIQNESDFGQWL